MIIFLTKNLIFIVANGLLLAVNKRHDPKTEISCTNKIFSIKNRLISTKVCSYRIFVALKPSKTNYKRIVLTYTRA